MTAAFTPIKIIGLNNQASGSSDEGADMMRVVLDLSEQAPPDWAEYFNHRWKQHIYMKKSRAQVSGKRLEIDCISDDLEKTHLPELRTVFEETNAAYATFYSKREAALQAEQAKRNAEAAKLAEMKKIIKFD
jgi:hypothetical protein